MTDNVVTEMTKEFGYTSPMQVPRMTKIVLNMGFDAETGKKEYTAIAEQFCRLTGQKPAPTRAKEAIATFKIRAGDIVGLKVTLRSMRMHSFFTRLVRIVLPRLRDFRGVPRRSFDARGAYTIGIPDYTIFPEVEFKKSEKQCGLEVTIVTNARSPKEARRLLAFIGMPFARKK